MVEDAHMDALLLIATRAGEEGYVMVRDMLGLTSEEAFQRGIWHIRHIQEHPEYAKKVRAEILRISEGL